MTSFIYPETLEELATGGGGWASAGAVVTANFAINYPGAYFDPFTPPPERDAPATAAAPIYVAVAQTTITGRAVTDGKCYSDALVWDELPDNATWQVYTGPGGAHIWEEYVAQVVVYGLVILYNGQPLYYTDEAGADAVALNGVPVPPFESYVPTYQDVTLNPGGQPWFALAG